MQGVCCGAWRVRLHCGHGTVTRALHPRLPRLASLQCCRLRCLLQPWLGDVWDNLDLFIPGQSDKLNLQGFNDYLNDAIRQVDNETLIFFEVVCGDAHSCWQRGQHVARRHRSATPVAAHVRL